MSLDVSLYRPQETEWLIAADLLEERGFEHTATFLRTSYETENRCLYSSNITHNLSKMADACGIYQACWRPEEIGIKTAADLIPLLEKGLSLLEADPDRFRKYDSPNGWGIYDDFVPWVREYLSACQAHPTALVEVSR